MTTRRTKAENSIPPKAGSATKFAEKTKLSRPKKVKTGYDIFIKECKASSVSIQGKRIKWLGLSMDAKAIYRKKAAAWNKNNTEYSTQPATKVKPDKQMKTKVTKKAVHMNTKNDKHAKPAGQENVATGVKHMPVSCGAKPISNNTNSDAGIGTNIGWLPKYYRTEYELRTQLADVDFSMVMPGDTVQLWVAYLVSDVGECDFPIIDITIPKDQKYISQRAVLESIVEKFVSPLNCDDTEDVIMFYSLLVALMSSSENQCGVAERVALVREFEKGGCVAALPLLRIGKYLPVAEAMRPCKNRNGKVIKGKFELIWTN